MLPTRYPRGRAVASLILAAALASCGFGREKEPPPPLGETFSAEDTYSRSYPMPPAAACEAARRALLGQGYVIGDASADALTAVKSFQPESDVHTQLHVRTTCVRQADGGSIVFVNAVQDRYALKTQTKSASVGVSVLGSVSVPIGSSGATLVRVASNTVQNTGFYSRFFDRVAYYLPGADAVMAPPPEPDVPPDPVPGLVLPENWPADDAMPADEGMPPG